VRISLRDRLQVLEVPGVARLVGFNGTPAALPDVEIETLKAGLESGVTALPHAYLKVGRRVRIIAGPLAGITGILLRHKGKSRVAISIDLIQRSVVVDADSADVEAIR
jgi:transcription antitermination factor NusG